MRGRSNSIVAMPTAAGLERSAQWHLSRRALTEAQLRQALVRKLDKARRGGHVFDDAVLRMMCGSRVKLRDQCEPWARAAASSP
jgi:hypothetical protein